MRYPKVVGSLDLRKGGGSASDTARGCWPFLAACRAFARNLGGVFVMMAMLTSQGMHRMRGSLGMRDTRKYTVGLLHVNVRPHVPRQSCGERVEGKSLDAVKD